MRFSIHHDEAADAKTVNHHLANAHSKVGATTTAQLKWILAARLPGPEGAARTNDQRPA
jgi:hypothetical protein